MNLKGDVGVWRKESVRGGNIEVDTVQMQIKDDLPKSCKVFPSNLVAIMNCKLEVPFFQFHRTTLLMNKFSICSHPNLVSYKQVQVEFAKMRGCLVAIEPKMLSCERHS